MFTKYQLINDDTIVNQEGVPIKVFRSNKYLQCCLFDDDGNKYVMGVHTAVAMLGITEWYDGCVVHHKDGDTHNNSLTNLEIMSRETHSRHHWYDGSYAGCKNHKNMGESNGQSKLTVDDVKYIKKYHIKGDREFGATAMGKKFGVSKTSILDILKGKTWAHVDI